jgi:hypothetical protein
MVEAVSTSEKLVSFYQIAWQSMPEDSYHHNRRRENTKLHHVQV